MMSFPSRIIAALAAAILAVTIVLEVTTLPHDGGLGRDFSAFYAAGLALRQHLNPYNCGQIGAIERHLPTIADATHTVAFNAYSNPPLFAWAMSLLAHVAQPRAYTLWLVIIAAALIGSLWLLAREYGRPWLLLPFALTPTAAICLFMGQQTPLLLAGLSIALVALRRSRPRLAGIVLCIGWIKPHLLFPPALVLVALLSAPDRRALLRSFGLASFALAALSCLLTGPALLITWLQYFLSLGGSLTAQPLLASMSGLYMSFLGRPWNMIASAISLAIWIVIAALLIRQGKRRQVQPGQDAFLSIVALSLTGWLLLTPYAHPADLVLVVPALVLLRWQDALARLAIVVLLLAPAADMWAVRPTYAFTYSFLIPLTLTMALRPFRMWTASGRDKAVPARIQVAVIS